MQRIPTDEDVLQRCAAFWHSLYRDMPYVHRPDGYQNVNCAALGPEYFLRHLGAGLSGGSPAHWHGEVTHDSIFAVEGRDGIAGFAVTAVDRDRGRGSILSAYVERGPTGRQAGDALLGLALDYFRSLGLEMAVAAPDVTKSLEAESPFHLALLDAGFAWPDNWEPPPNAQGVKLVAAEPGYGVVLGGSLKGFRAPAATARRREELRREGVAIERCSARDTGSVARLDTGEPIGKVEGEDTYVALADGRAVGWLWEVVTWTDWAEGEGARVMGGAVPEVIPGYRGRGIGKVLYHLGIEEVAARGAECGWTVTGICNPARLIYRSVGYRYWYLAFSMMAKAL